MLMPLMYSVATNNCNSSVWEVTMQGYQLSELEESWSEHHVMTTRPNGHETIDQAIRVVDD